MAGSLSLALTQVLDVDGKPMAGAMLYFFVAGTVATPQDSFADYSLTNLNPNPLVADQYGRIPNFYLADGQVHARLTDQDGVVIFDQPNMQVLGPSSGSGGGGGTVDPTTVAQTGDIKFRATNETLTGWVKANGTTVGSASSSAVQRANADAQALYVYLWNNYTNAHCPVTGGRGSSGLADFQANKPIAVPDYRGRGPIGLDDMGTFAAGRVLNSNVTSAGDNATTPAATGGESNHTLSVSEAPTGQHTLADSGHFHGLPDGSSFLGTSGPGGPIAGGGTFHYSVNTYVAPALANVSLVDHAGGQAHNNMPPFMLGSWYMKL